MSFSNPLFINTILLKGTTEEKIEAASQAGFDQIEIWREDVSSASGSGEALNNFLHSKEIGLTDYQVLLDFDGASTFGSSKRDEALEMIDVAREIGADTLLVPANTSDQCDPNKIIDDLTWLVDEAGKHGLKIAYEAMAWSKVINTLPEAWDIVKKVNRPNFGLVVDAFHIFSLGRTVADLDDIPAEKIFLVQLSDLKGLPDRENMVNTARHDRLLPGEGDFPLDKLLHRLKSAQYSGPIGLEVFNDELKAKNAVDVAEMAMLSLKNVVK